MRTFDYAILTLLIGALVIWGAVTVSKAVTGAMNNTAQMIENGGR